MAETQSIYPNNNAPVYQAQQQPQGGYQAAYGTPAGQPQQGYQPQHQQGGYQPGYSTPAGQPGVYVVKPNYATVCGCEARKWVLVLSCITLALDVYAAISFVISLSASDASAVTLISDVISIISSLCLGIIGIVASTGKRAPDPTGKTLMIVWFVIKGIQLSVTAFNFVLVILLFSILAAIPVLIFVVLYILFLIPFISYYNDFKDGSGVGYGNLP